MPSTSTATFKPVFASLLALVVVSMVGFAALGMSNATAERQTASAARDLQIAAMKVAVADGLMLAGSDRPPLDLGASLETLSTKRDAALRRLPEDQSDLARALLDEITGCGTMLLDPGALDHVVHGHDELHAILAVVVDDASAGAATAERRAFWAIIAACLAVMPSLWFMLRLRLQSEHDRDRAELQERARRRLQVLLDDSPDSSFVIDLDGQIIYRSDSGDRLLGGDGISSRDDLVSLAEPSKRAALRDHVGRTGASGASAVFVLRDTAGAHGWYQIRVSDLTGNETVDGHVITARNITNEVELRDELQRQADTDQLTGLPNRRILHRALTTAANRLAEHDGICVVMVLDVDGFKNVNDTMGHAAGDELLIRVAERLEGAKAADDVLIRLGGDEFAVIIPVAASVAEAEQRGRRLLAAFDDPFRIGPSAECVRCSIGAAITADSSKVVDLLRDADVAMYESKRRGDNVVVIHDPAVADASTRPTRIAAALRAADHDSEFHLVYQPIVDIEADRITTLEALLRWTSPDLGVVAPNEFIAVAEVTGDICKIGRWVIDSACRQLAAWSEAGINPDVAVSFNVSPRQLVEEQFVDCLLDTARAWSISPSRLVLDVTESTALDQTGVAIARLEQLRAAGLRISIDDFGSGYSNLGQLLTVPFDVIKIDRSLLLTLSAMRERSGIDPNDSCAIMAAIVSIAGVLQAPVVCEGVETEDQRASLAASGITHIQGFLTGRPALASTITAELCPATPKMAGG